MDNTPFSKKTRDFFGSIRSKAQGLGDTLDRNLNRINLGGHTAVTPIQDKVFISDFTPGTPEWIANRKKRQQLFESGNKTLSTTTAPPQSQTSLDRATPPLGDLVKPPPVQQPMIERTTPPIGDLTKPPAQQSMFEQKQIRPATDNRLFYSDQQMNNLLSGEMGSEQWRQLSGNQSITENIRGPQRSSYEGPNATYEPIRRTFWDNKTGSEYGTVREALQGMDQKGIDNITKQNADYRQAMDVQKESNKGSLAVREKANEAVPQYMPVTTSAENLLKGTTTKTNEAFDTRTGKISNQADTEFNDAINNIKTKVIKSDGTVNKEAALKILSEYHSTNLPLYKRLMTYLGFPLN